MRPDLVEVDAIQQRNVWELVRTHPTVSVCLKTLEHLVIGSGVAVAETLPDKAVTKTFCLNEINLIAIKALRWLTVIGVVPMMFKKQEDNKLGLLSEQETSLFVRMDAWGKIEYLGQFQRSVSIIGMNHDAKAPKVVVWGKGGYGPNAAGQLVTPITHLESTEVFVKHLRLRVMIAEVLRSNPFCYTQSRHKVNTDTEGVMWNVTDEVVQKAEERRMDGLENAQMRHSCKHTAMIRETWGSGLTDLGSGIEAAIEEGCTPREHFLAAERELSRPVPVTSAVQELIQHTRQADEKIFQLFGIPMEMFSQAGSELKTNYMQEHALNANLASVKLTVQNFLNDALRLLDSLRESGFVQEAGSSAQYANERAKNKEEDEAEPQNKKPKKEPAADQAAPAFADDTALNTKEREFVCLPGNPVVRTEMLRDAHNMACISREEMVTLLRGSIGLKN